MNKPNLKSPPYSKESEMMVLGCMLTSVNGLNIGAQTLRPDEFYFPEHKQIFQCSQQIYKQDRPLDIHIAAQELKRLGTLDAVGGIAYLTDLGQYVGTSAHIEEYCNIVKNKALLRKMIDAAQRVEKNALEEPANVGDALNDAQALFYAIGQSHGKKEGIHINEVLDGSATESKIPFLKELEKRQERYQTLGPEQSAVTGMPTHLVDLDKMINGLNNSNLMILACRPAMGKTALALNIAEQVCFKNNVPVGFFSLEMGADQLVHRMICSQAEVASDKIKTGALTGEEYQQVASAVANMQNKDFIIDDQPGLKISDLRARARRMKENYGIGLLVIDYLQLLSGTGSAQTLDSRQNEVSEISRILKTLARELNIPVLCAAQLSRKVDDRHNHRPMLSDLRESGSIEQDADIVMFLLRREYYDPLDKPGTAEVIVAKNRHGPVGSVHLTCRMEISQFSNFAPDSLESQSQEEEIKEHFSEFSPV